MSKELYREIIMRHGSNPANKRIIEDADGTAELENPLCGDMVCVYVKTENHKITDAAFDGYGCKLCVASASIMTEEIDNLGIDSTLQKCRQLHEFIQNDEEIAVSKNWEALGMVKNFPSRKRCVTLPWECLKKILIKL